MGLGFWSGGESIGGLGSGVRLTWFLVGERER